MVVERFGQGVVNSGLLNFFIATGFFATLIFFVLNAHIYTPFEIIFWVVTVTVALKGLSNLMLSLIILLFNLQNKQDEMDFENNKDNIESLLSELTVQEARLKSSQYKSER